MKKKTAKKAKKAKPDKQAKSGERIKGKFAPGTSGNPAGRPKGISITEAIKAELEKKPEGSKMTFLQATVKKILTKIIVEGDSRTIGKLWDHIDGAPKQKIELPDDTLAIFIKKPDNMKEP